MDKADQFKFALQRIDRMMYNGLLAQMGRDDHSSEDKIEIARKIAKRVSSVCRDSYDD